MVDPLPAEGCGAGGIPSVDRSEDVGRDPVNELGCHRRELLHVAADVFGRGGEEQALAEHGAGEHPPHRSGARHCLGGFELTVCAVEVAS